MSENSLSFKYCFEDEVSTVFDAIISEQLKFFKQYKPEISLLTKGLYIEKELTTKTSNKPVKVKLKINEIIKDEKFELSTIYSEGEILQTYSLANSDGKTIVLYSEKNMFEKKSYVFNFKVISLFYKFFYNRNIKKRMRYLESVINNQKGNMIDPKEEN